MPLLKIDLASLPGGLYQLIRDRFIQHSTIEQHDRELSKHWARVSAKQGTTENTGRLICIQIAQLDGLLGDSRPNIAMLLPEMCIELLNPRKLHSTKKAPTGQKIIGCILTCHSDGVG